MPDLKALIAEAATGRPLSREQAADAFDIMMSGEATPAQMGGFLMALRVRGESVDEIAAAAAVMRRKMTRVEAPDNAVDIVGTGGDAAGTYNISTCAAFIVAGAGTPVAKHGNRALSSRSGAADALAALGVRLELGPEAISRCIAEAGVGFMFAPNHHLAMRYVGPTRVELGTRTIFNLLGPLSNPASVRRQMVGVFAREWVEPLARVLLDLGSEHAWVVHGSDGLDEITTTGPTTVAEARDGEVRVFEVTPEDAGLPRAPKQDLRGGDAAHNATALRSVLRGVRGPYRDIAVLNAAAALMVAGRARDLREGAAIAVQAIDSGAADAALDRLIAVSQASHVSQHASQASHASHGPQARP